MNGCDASADATSVSHLLLLHSVTQSLSPCLRKCACVCDRTFRGAPNALPRRTPEQRQAIVRVEAQPIAARLDTRTEGGDWQSVPHTDHKRTTVQAMNCLARQYKCLTPGTNHTAASQCMCNTMAHYSTRSTILNMNYLRCHFLASHIFLECIPWYTPSFTSYSSSRSISCCQPFDPANGVSKS